MASWRRHISMKVAAGSLMLLSAVGGVSAQSVVPQEKPAVHKQQPPAPYQDSQSKPGTAKDKIASKASTHVTLVVRDSTLNHAIYAIAAQAGLRVIYDGSTRLSSRRVTVRIVNVPVLDAYRQLLKGTGLEAVLSPDRETVIVRAPISTSAVRDTTATGEIVGTVVDSATGKRISGVAVTLVGTEFTALTGEQGTFVIKGVASGDYTLTLKVLGYAPETRRIRIDANQAIRLALALKPSATSLTEVVTTATGLQRRVEVANDIAKVNADSLLRIAPARSVSDLLAVARIPGVEVTPSSGLPGAPSRIRLRGVGSISRSNDPVVIVDGIWINAATSTADVGNQARFMSDIPGKFSSNTSVSSRLDDIDPNSIETIEVLRGPSAASLYGTDAANGVIIITTKRGKAGTTRWGLNADFSTNKTPGQYQPRYRSIGRGLFNTLDDDCRLSEVFDLLCVIDSVSARNPLNDVLLTNEASGHDAQYNASVSGGTSALQYHLGVTNQDLTGALTLPLVEQIRLRRLGEAIPGWLTRPEQLKRTSVSTQLTMQPLPALSLGLMIAATQSDQRSGRANFSQIASFSFFPEDTLLFARDGVQANRERLGSKVTSGKIGLTVDWRPWSWFVPNVTLGLDRNARTDNGVSTRRYCMDAGCELPRADVIVFRGDQSMYTANVRSQFPVSLGRWERFLSFKPSIGANLRRSLSSGLTSLGDSLALGSEDIGTAAYREVRPALSTNSATGGWYLDVQVGVLQRFYTTLGFRQDIGSALSNRISVPTYPKLGTTWLVSDESFFPKNEIVKTLRLRMIYGHSAIQPDISAVRGGYQNLPSIVNGQIVNGIYATRLGNFELRPERAVELEYGIDADLFGDRTQLTVTVATKRNRDQLVERTLAASVGGLGTGIGRLGVVGGNFTENIARVINRSVEMSLSHRVIDRPHMVWSVNMSGSTLLNRVEKIGTGVTPSENPDARIAEGYPLNSVWAYPIVAYNDVNGDGLLQPDELVVGDTMTYIGWPHPRYALNYGTTLQLLNGRLNLTANFAYDGQLTQLQQQYDNWGAYDPAAPLYEQARAMGEFRPGMPSNLQATGNRQTISVARFNNASATFILPDVWARQLKATTASISLQGSNLGLWTRYRGRDPGVNSSPIGEALVDDGTTLPQPRKYALSLRLNF